MNEVPSFQPNREGDTVFRADNRNTQTVDIPTVLRDARGRIRWTLPGNTPEENEQLGIRNVQALFLENFPGFDELYPRGEDGKIPEDKGEETKSFILDKIGTQRKQSALFGSTPLNTRKVSYFGSPEVIIRKSFSPWGLQFENPHKETKLIGETSSEVVLFMALPQLDGLNNLKDYLKGIKPFDELKPFLIRDVWVDPKGYARIHVDK